MAVFFFNGTFSHKNQSEMSFWCGDKVGEEWNAKFKLAFLPVGCLGELADETLSYAVLA